MAEIRKWTVQYRNLAGTGGGGFSTFWSDSVAGTGFQSGLIGTFLDSWAAVAQEDWNAQILPGVDVYESTTGMKVGEDTNPDLAVRVGTVTSPQLPNQTQMCIQIRTNVFVNGRRLRGRSFVPGFSINSSLEGQPAPATVTAIEDNFPAGAIFGVYSATHLIFAPSTARIANIEWCVQRRRRD